MEGFPKDIWILLIKHYFHPETILNMLLVSKKLNALVKENSEFYKKRNIILLEYKNVQNHHGELTGFPDQQVYCSLCDDIFYVDTFDNHVKECEPMFIKCITCLITFPFFRRWNDKIVSHGITCKISGNPTKFTFCEKKNHHYINIKNKYK